MSGYVPNFQSGSNQVIYIGNVIAAYITNLSFSRNMSQGAVGGIGGYSYDAQEALSYSASGSFTLTRYTSAAADAVKKVTGGEYKLPTKSNSGFPNPGTDGNSMLHPAHFNPSKLLTGKTFDIKVFERRSQSSNDAVVVYTLKDCRLSGYSIGFTPGSLVSENLSFKCLRIVDAADEPLPAIPATP
jgi:hypothetical protein